MDQRELDEAARCAAEALLRTRTRLVLAESCTGGLIAASLAQTPGISECLCGSAVVYRTATKTAWLGVPAELLADPAIGPVSAEASAAIARGVLARTPEAQLALGITGHLGPDAPVGLDGVVHIAISWRGETAEDRIENERRWRFELPSSSDAPSLLRRQRLFSAAIQGLNVLASFLDAGQRIRSRTG